MISKHFKLSDCKVYILLILLSAAWKESVPAKHSIRKTAEISNAQTQITLQTHRPSRIQTKLVHYYPDYDFSEDPDLRFRTTTTAPFLEQQWFYSRHKHPRNFASYFKSIESDFCLQNHNHNQTNIPEPLDDLDEKFQYEKLAEEQESNPEELETTQSPQSFPEEQTTLTPDTGSKPPAQVPYQYDYDYYAAPAPPPTFGWPPAPPQYAYEPEPAPAPSPTFAWPGWGLPPAPAALPALPPGWGWPAAPPPAPAKAKPPSVFSALAQAFPGWGWPFQFPFALPSPVKAKPVDPGWGWPAPVKETPVIIKQKSKSKSKPVTVIKEKPIIIKEKPIVIKEKPTVIKEKPVVIKEKGKYKEKEKEEPAPPPVPVPIPVPVPLPAPLPVPIPPPLPVPVPLGATTPPAPVPMPASTFSYWKNMWNSFIDVFRFSDSSTAVGFRGFSENQTSPANGNATRKKMKVKLAPQKKGKVKVHVPVSISFNWPSLSSSTKLHEKGERME